MRAICFVLRNRVRAGWCDSSWLHVIASTEVEVRKARHDNPTAPPVTTALPMIASDRLLQMIIRDVDDIYMGQDRSDDSTRLMVVGDNPPKTSALYYMFVDRPVSAWFAENIVRKPAEHPQTGNIGPLMLFR